MLFNQLGEFGLNQLLARRLTTAGPAPSPTVEPAIFPALVLENDRPEYSYTKGERLCAGATGVAAGGAGFFATVLLVNPVNSNVLLTLNWVRIITAASTVSLRISNAELFGAPVTSTVRDGRWIQAGATAARPVGLVSTVQLPGIPLEPAVVFAEASLQSDIELPIILRPAQSLQIVATTANIAINRVNLSWYERTAQPGEL